MEPLVKSFKYIWPFHIWKNFKRVLFKFKVRSRNISKKNYELLLTEIVFSPDEVFAIYVEFSEELHIDTNTYNILIQKANSYI